MKKSKFIPDLIGIVLLIVGQLFRYSIPIKLNEESVFNLHVIPEALCYLLLFIGFCLLRKYSNNFKTAMVFGILGFIASAVMEVLKQNYAQNVSFAIVCELISGLLLIGSLFYYATGIYSAAHKAGLTKTAANASTYRFLFGIFKSASIILNVLFIIFSNTAEIAPLWISLLSIIFSALVYAAELLILILTVNAMNAFAKIPDSTL